MSEAQHGSKQHRGKRRKQSQRRRAIAAVGVATATAAALTVAMAPAPETNVAKIPVALMASTGPDYTQLIKETSNSLDALLLDGTLTNALNVLLNPLGATLTATAGQDNLLQLDGAINALVNVLNQIGTLPDVSNVPGLPPGAGDVLTQNLGPVLDAVALLLPLTDILNNLSGAPGALDDALANLGVTNTLLTSLLGVPPISTVLNLAGIQVASNHDPERDGLA